MAADVFQIRARGEAIVRKNWICPQGGWFNGQAYQGEGRTADRTQGFRTFIASTGLDGGERAQSDQGDGGGEGAGGHSPRSWPKRGVWAEYSTE